MKEIFVTAADIEAGNPTSINDCAAARAIRRATGRDVTVVVSTYRIGGQERQLANGVFELIHAIGRYKLGRGPKPSPLQFSLFI